MAGRRPQAVPNLQATQGPEGYDICPRFPALGNLRLGRYGMGGVGGGDVDGKGRSKVRRGERKNKVVSEE